MNSNVNQNTTENLDPEEAVELFKRDRFGELDLDYLDRSPIEEIIQDNLESLFDDSQIQRFFHFKERQGNLRKKKRSLTTVGPEEKHYLTKNYSLGEGLEFLMSREVSDLSPDEASIVEANIYHHLENYHDRVITNPYETIDQETDCSLNNFEGRIQSDALYEMVKDNTSESFEIEDFIVGRQETNISADGGSGHLEVSSSPEGHRVRYEPEDAEVDSDFTVAGIEIFESEEGALSEEYTNPEYLAAAISALSAIDQSPELLENQTYTKPAESRYSKFIRNSWE